MNGQELVEAGVIFKHEIGEITEWEFEFWRPCQEDKGVNQEIASGYFEADVKC